MKRKINTTECLIVKIEKSEYFIYAIAQYYDVLARNVLILLNENIHKC